MPVQWARSAFTKRTWLDVTMPAGSDMAASVMSQLWSNRVRSRSKLSQA
jgi:hypothetical protein